jgi:plastocyanin
VKGVSLVDRILRLAALLATAALLVPGAAGSRGPQQNKLIGTVGPGFTITLTTEGGQAVSQLEPGTYTIEVRDLSANHNFHLTGPGVDRRTQVEFRGTETWEVTVQAGTYNYVCDPHASAMRGRFAVSRAAQPPPPSPPPPPARASKAKRLTGTVGPGFTISLKDSGGRKVRRLKAGAYRITVRDRSSSHNFHLTGRGVNKRTSVSFRGTATWTVRLRKGRTYRFVCDPHAREMRGSFRAT